MLSDLFDAAWQDLSDGFFQPLDHPLVEDGVLFSYHHLFDSADNHHPHSQGLLVAPAVRYSSYIFQPFQHHVFICQDQDDL